MDNKECGSDSQQDPCVSLTPKSNYSHELVSNKWIQENRKLLNYILGMSIIYIYHVLIHKVPIIKVENMKTMEELLQGRPTLYSCTTCNSCRLPPINNNVCSIDQSSVVKSTCCFVFIVFIVYFVSISTYSMILFFMIRV